MTANLSGAGRHQLPVRERSVLRRIVLRGSSLAGLLALMVLLPAATPDVGLQAVAPLFAVLIFLQFMPLFWASEPDLCSPPVLFGILAALASLGTLAGQFIAGYVRLDLIHGIDSDQMSALAQKVLWASIIGLSCYYLGFYMQIGRGLRNKFPKVAGLEWRMNRIRLVAIATMLIFLVAYAAFQRRAGGSIFDATSLGMGKQIFRNNPKLTWLFRGAQFGFFPAMLYLAWACRKKGYTHLAIASGVLGVMALMVLRLGQRGVSMTVMLSALIIIHYLRRRIPAMAFLGMLFLAVLANNLLYQYRTNPDDAMTQRVSLEPKTVLANYDSERQRFSALALVMKEFPANHDYLLGESWLGLIATPIPRWIWPQKAQHFKWRDTSIVNQLGGGPIPTPFLGVLYVNFSWLGIIIGMFLWGVFHRALYEWLKDNVLDLNVVLLYSFIFIHFGPSLLQMSATIQYIVPLYMILRWVGYRPRVGPSPSGIMPGVAATVPAAATPTESAAS